jgi:KUP system potassium uptake protein
MLVWFSMLGILGLIQITKWSIQSFQPLLCYNFIIYSPDGFFVLGFVFFATGAEALYSDMDIVVERILELAGFCKTTLVLNYFGQAAFLIHGEKHLHIGWSNGNRSIL